MKTFLTAFFIIAGAASVLCQKITVVPEKKINTAFQEYSPAFYENGLVFISSNPTVDKSKEEDSRTGKATTSIFWAKRDPAGRLGKPQPFSDNLTTKFYDGPLTFSPSNDMVYFTRSTLRRGKPVVAKDGRVKLKIYSAQKVGPEWKNIKELPFNGPDFDCAHPAISVDGQRIYFSSNRPGGMGGMDLYVSLKQGDQWGDAVNLGPKINTKKDDVFPYMHADGTLFFSTNGRKGEGGLDIFYSKKTNKGWTDPKSLGAPVNSKKDDFGLIVDIDKKNGYFSSNRGGGAGDDDIFSFYAPDGLLQDPKPSAIQPTLVTATPVAAEQETVVKIETRVKGAGVPLPQVKFSYTDLSDVNGAAILTDSLGGVVKLKSAQGGGVLMDSMLQKQGATNDQGMASLKLTPGKRYLFHFTLPRYLPKYLTKTIAINKDEAVAILEKEGETPPMSTPHIEKIVEETGGKKPVTEKLAHSPEESPVEITSSGAPLAKETEQMMSVDSAADSDASRYASTAEFNDHYSFNDEAKAGELLKPGAVIQLSNIYYNFNDADVRPEARKDLDALVTLLRAYPEIEIELASFTDSRGSAEYNQKLSQHRANNLLDYLTDKGIDQNRVKAVGYGETVLKNRCADGVDCDEEEHQVNRRTEVKIMKNSPRAIVIVKTDPPAKVVENMRVNVAPSLNGAAPAKDADFTTARKTSRKKGASSLISVKDTFNLAARTDSAIAYARTGTPIIESNALPENNSEFLVVVGTYSLIENARITLRKAIEAGFIDTKIIHYNWNNLYSVCIKRYASAREAEELSAVINKEKDFESFVKQRKR